MIPTDYWVIVDHEAWEEAVLLFAGTAQEAEDKAMAFIKEAILEDNPDAEDWEDLAFGEGGNWTIRNASYKPYEEDHV